VTCLSNDLEISLNIHAYDLRVAIAIEHLTQYNIGIGTMNLMFRKLLVTFLLLFMIGAIGLSEGSSVKRLATDQKKLTLKHCRKATQNATDALYIDHLKLP